MSQNQKKYIADIYPGEEGKEVHTLHRLNAAAIEVFDQTMWLPTYRANGKKEIHDETQNLPTESETSRINEETRDSERGGNSHSNVKGQ